MSSIRIFLFLLILLFGTSLLISQEESLYPKEELTLWCGTDQKSIAEVGQLLRTTWTLKILLVEFSDVKHKTPGYTFANFNNLFFSSGVYVSPNMYSPDGEPLFGSMNDYLQIMSDGDFSISGYVVNRDNNSDGIPDWLTLPLRKGQYDSTTSFSTFENAAFAAANAAGLDVSTNSTTKLAIIYAGHTYRGLWDGIHYSGLNPHANYIGGTFYINGELFAAGAPYRSERPDAKFSEIGINTHEFLHLVDLPDLYDNGV